MASHKTILAAFGNNQGAAGCTQCHTPTQNNCTSCHQGGVSTKTQWHPDFWWVKHAQTTKPSDVANCNRCHSQVQPSCTKCHARSF